MDAYDNLRRNLTLLMDAARDGLRAGPTGVLALEAETDIGKSTLYRILDPQLKNPTQLDKLERLGQAYGLQPWQLLAPNFDPLDPPATIGAQRFAVLRSVFAQVQNATQDEGGTHQGGGPSNPRDRLRASGTPHAGAAATAAGKRRKPAHK